MRGSDFVAQSVSRCLREDLLQLRDADWEGRTHERLREKPAGRFEPAMLCVVEGKLRVKLTYTMIRYRCMIWLAVAGALRLQHGRATLPRRYAKDCL